MDNNHHTFMCKYLNACLSCCLGFGDTMAKSFLILGNSQSNRVDNFKRMTAMFGLRPVTSVTETEQTWGIV